MFNKSRWSAIALLVATAFLHTACPDKGGNNPPPPPAVPVAIVPGAQCLAGTYVQGTGGVLAQAVGRTYDDQIHLGLVFNMMTAPTGTGLGQQQYYSGQVSANGYLVVKSPVQRQFCPIPPGTYTIRTVTAGNWQMHSFWGLQLEATGPATLRIRLPSNWVLNALPPVVGADGIMYNYKLQNSMYVETLNCVSCMLSSEFFLE